MRKRRHRVDAKLSKEQVRAAHRLYMAGLSFRKLAALGWETWGFASPEAAQRSLRHAFHAAGLPVRTVSQAKRLQMAVKRPRHRPGEWWKEGYCQETVNNYPNIDRACRRRVRRGERFCAKHAPRLAEKVAREAARARAGKP